MNAVEPSLELRCAISDYHVALDRLRRLGAVVPDRFGYSTETFRDYEADAIRTKERMETLSACDYRHAGN